MGRYGWSENTSESRTPYRHGPLPPPPPPSLLRPAAAAEEPPSDPSYRMWHSSTGQPDSVRLGLWGGPRGGKTTFLGALRVAAALLPPEHGSWRIWGLHPEDAR